MKQRDAGTFLYQSNNARGLTPSLIGSAPALGDRVAYVVIKGIKSKFFFTDSIISDGLINHTPFRCRGV